MSDTAPYTIPDQTRIGHIHVKVAYLDRALSFYRDLPGFSLVTMYGTEAAFVSAGGYHGNASPASYWAEHLA